MTFSSIEGKREVKIKRKLIKSRELEQPTGEDIHANLTAGTPHPRSPDIIVQSPEIGRIKIAFISVVFALVLQGKRKVHHPVVGKAFIENKVDSFKVSIIIRSLFSVLIPAVRNIAFEEVIRFASRFASGIGTHFIRDNSGLEVFILGGFITSGGVIG